MVCSACGGRVAPDMRFCSLCGAQVIAVQPGPQQYPAYSAYAPMMVQPRVQRHLQNVGMLWCVFAAWRVVESLIGMFFLKAFVFRRWHGDWPPMHHGLWFAPQWMHLMPFIAAAAVVSALFALFVGWSLLTRKTWGRVLAIVAAVLVLFKFPFGTALGVYTLWVLAPAVSGLEYDSMAEPG
jgi:hypothetical protein